MSYRASDYIAFWDGINAIVRASGGSDACTNVARQKAVVDVERALANLCKADREPLVQEVIAALDAYDKSGDGRKLVGVFEAVRKLAEFRP